MTCVNDDNYKDRGNWYNLSTCFCISQKEKKNISEHLIMDSTKNEKGIYAGNTKFLITMIAHFV